MWRELDWEKARKVKPSITEELDEMTSNPILITHKLRWGTKYQFQVEDEMNFWRNIPVIVSKDTEKCGGVLQEQ